MAYRSRKLGRNSPSVEPFSLTCYIFRFLRGPQERLYYDAQLENKQFRGMSNLYGLEREWEAQYRKGRKLYYRGKPTRWHEWLLKLERQTAATAPALLRMLDGY